MLEAQDRKEEKIEIFPLRKKKFEAFNRFGLVTRPRMDDTKNGTRDEGNLPKKPDFVKFSITIQNEPN